MNAGARIALALNVAATAGLIAFLLATKEDLTTNGIPLDIPLAGQIKITPKLKGNDQTLMIAGGVAVAAAVIAFVVSG